MASIGNPVARVRDHEFKGLAKSLIDYLTVLLKYFRRVNIGLELYLLFLLILKGLKTLTHLLKTIYTTLRGMVY
jgi:hypothetical protein